MQLKTWRYLITQCDSYKLCLQPRRDEIHCALMKSDVAWNFLCFSSGWQAEAESLKWGECCVRVAVKLLTSLRSSPDGAEESAGGGGEGRASSPAAQDELTGSSHWNKTSEHQQRPHTNRLKIATPVNTSYACPQIDLTVSAHSAQVHNEHSLLWARLSCALQPGQYAGRQELLAIHIALWWEWLRGRYDEGPSGQRDWGAA